jgi:MYXO-CTERM domain-containing protein
MRRLGLVWSLSAAVTWSGAAQAAIGNLSYQQSEVGVPLASFNETTFTGPPGGSNTVLMLRDYMVVMGSHDSGVKDGPLHVFDVSNPREPKLLKRFTSAETGNLRELHAMPVAMLDGKDILVLPSVTGLTFFDFTDPLNPAAIGSLALDGVNGGDYDNAAWMLSWAWPYVYAGGTGNGIYVVDAHDPTKPTLVKRIQTGELGGFRIGPVYAAGNYIVASGMDAMPTQVAVLDAGDPAKPFLLTKGAAPTSMYSSVVIGDRIYGTGEGGEYSFMKWSPDAVEVIGGKSLKLGADKGGYCTYQDAFIFCGQSSEGYRKIDVSDEANIKEVSHADIPVEGADTDFATVLGNLVYLGNDHGSGAAFFAHDMAPDSKPPKLLGAYPQDGDLQQPLGTRITLFFSDEIDLDSISPESVIVRPVGGAPVEGVFSHSSFNAVSFGAKAPLTDDTTYEVVLVKDGLKDLAQNPLAEQSVVRFSTGATIDAPVSEGGAGGAMSAGGTMSAGGSGGMPSESGGSESGGKAPSAGTTASAGTTSSAGTTTANPTPGGGGDDAGCGCSVPGESGPARGWAVAALTALAISRARRRAARKGACRS